LHVQAHLHEDCQGETMVPRLFRDINAAAHSTKYCHTAFSGAPACQEILRKFKTPKDLRSISLLDSPNTKFIPEGQYATLSPEESYGTVGISYCVGLALTNIKSPSTSESLLAHINDENIQANDNHLRSNGRSPDPFSGIRDFINNKPTDYQATLVSGSIGNIAYMKTLLTSMGINSFTMIHESRWATDTIFSPSDRDKLILDHGNLVIHEGSVYLLNNPKQYKKFIQSIASDLKNKPSALQNNKTASIVIEPSPPPVFFSYETAHQTAEREAVKTDKKAYARNKDVRKREIRRKKRP